MVAVVVDFVVLPCFEDCGDSDLTWQTGDLHPFDHSDCLHRSDTHVPGELKQLIISLLQHNVDRVY